MATRFKLSFAQGDVLAQGKAAGHPGQAGAANQRRASLGQLPFGDSRETQVEFGGDNQFEYGISQELHTLVGIQG